MKKRKELDALVPNGKVKKKHSSSSGASHELLRVDSDTTDTEEFSVLQPRKLNSSKVSWFARLCSACLPICAVTLVVACIVGSGILIWMQFGMRQEVDVLREHVWKVEESNKGMPSEFHTIHSQLSDLQKNYSALKEEFNELNKTLESVSKEVGQLRKTTKDLQKSVAEAPQLENLPKDVESLSKSFASMGSKITNVEEHLKQVNDQMTVNDGDKKQLQDQFQSLQKSVDELLADQHKAAPSQSLSPSTDAELKKLEDAVYKMNESIWEKLQWSLADLHEHHLSLENLTSRINQLAPSNPPDSDGTVRKVLDEVNLHLKAIVNDTIISLLGASLYHDMVIPSDVNGTVTLSSLIHYVQTLTRLYLSLLVNSHLMPSTELLAFNDTINLNFTNIVQETVNDWMSYVIISEDQKLKDVNATVIGLIDAYNVLENSSETAAKKLDALQTQVNQLQSSSTGKDSVVKTVSDSSNTSSNSNNNNNLSNNPVLVNSPNVLSPTSPTLPVATTAAVPTVITTLPSGENKNASSISLPYAGEHNVTDGQSTGGGGGVVTTTTNGPAVLSTGTLPSSVANNSNLTTGDGVATPGRIRKPSHTGGSLPDDLSDDQSIH